MLHADQIRKGQEQIQFSLAVLESARLQPLPTRARPAVAVSAQALRPCEITVSGSQLLVGFASGLVSVGLLVWAIIRLWLFGG